MNFPTKVSDPRATLWTVHAVGSAGLVLGLVTTWFLVIAPRQVVFAQNEAQRHEWTALMKRGPEIRAQFEKLRDAYESQKAKQAEFKNRLPADPQESEFLAQVAQLARNVNLDIREFRPGSVTPRANYSELEIELSAEGDYDGICRFLAGLPDLPRLSSLTATELVVTPENSAYPIRLKLSAYFVPMKSEERS